MGEERRAERASLRGSVVKLSVPTWFFSWAGIVHVNYCSVEGLIISSLSRRCSDDALMPLNALGAGAVQKKQAINSVIPIPRWGNVVVTCKDPGRKKMVAERGKA
ncbi:hypothetical protein GEV33_011172 [Tenebrio molitor]|uniref:Uncharacterized protein n=1 Tax=Tenebrio molitor TaxID=7067 RepID=A0A8J6HB98_TENMO|nr:hypothetical protein GEV33_011172 [Tenebrio molitor]